MKIFKCLLLSICCALAATDLSAQVYSAGANTTVSGGRDVYYTPYDTLAASESHIDTFKVTEHRNAVVFQVHSDKISGDLGGTIVLEGSASKDIPFVPLASFNIADQDKSYSHTVTDNIFSYYRLAISDTSATHSAGYKTFITVR